MKQKLRLILAAAMTIIVATGAKAQIPSTYYSEPATGTDFYIYNISQERFLNADGQYSQALLSTTPLKFQLTASWGKYNIEPKGTDLGENEAQMKTSVGT